MRATAADAGPPHSIKIVMYTVDTSDLPKLKRSTLRLTPALDTIRGHQVSVDCFVSCFFPLQPRTTRASRSLYKGVYNFPESFSQAKPSAL